jgi:hypothetical protein
MVARAPGKWAVAPAWAMSKGPVAVQEVVVVAVAARVPLR